MSAEHRRQISLERTWIPWLVAAGALLVYLVTLNRWITLTNGSLLLQTSGMAQGLPVQQPILFLLTLPVRLLPNAWEPIVLNGLTAVLASLTLALLARSVMILPHDRTREQRMRERRPGALLSIPLSWIPPVLAVLLCGLELTFWQNAISATGEMLDLLIFAALIYCLLRYRLFRNDRWLYAFTLLYGAGTANNYALITLFPAFFVAFIWIKGLSVFNTRFLLTSIGLGLAGLGFYLLLPLVHVTSDLSDASFWQVLKANLVAQKAVPTFFLNGGLPHRIFILALCLTSVVPVCLFGIRWKSMVGDTSAFGVMLRELMFYFMHVLFFVICIVVAFNPDFSPYEWSRREAGIRLPFLTLYYLGALVVGYCAGYLLLVCGQPPAVNVPRRTPALVNAAKSLLIALVWIALVAVPAGLIYVNLKTIRGENAPSYADYARLMENSLPAGKAVILSDDPIRYLLLDGELARAGRSDDYLLIDTRLLVVPAYNRRLFREHPEIWPELPKDITARGQVPQSWLLNAMIGVSSNQPIYYLHPSFGYYFEAFYPEPRGAVLQLKQYAPGALQPAPLAASVLEEQKQFWSKCEETALRPLIHRIEDADANARVVGSLYSRDLDWWGTELQKSGDIQAAGDTFKLALELNPDNLSAKINRDFNHQLQTKREPLSELPDDIVDTFGQARSWDQVLTAYGPFDEPRYCLRVGEIFLRGNLVRQAGQQLLRVIDLWPQHLSARISLAKLYLLTRHPTNAMEVVDEVLSRPDYFGLNRSNRLDLRRMEIAASLFTKDTNTVERLIQESLAQGRNDPDTLLMLTQVRLTQGRMEDALALTDDMLRLQPDSAEIRLNKTALLIQMNRLGDAIPILDKLVAEKPGNEKARLNRAIANLKAGHYHDAQRDYEVLLAAHPDLYSLHFGLGEIGYDTTNRALALEHYRLYLKNAPPGLPEAKKVEARLKELEAAD